MISQEFSDKYSYILQALSVPIMACHKDSHEIIFVNSAFSILSGYEESKVLGQSYTQLFVEKSHQKVKDFFDIFDICGPNSETAIKGPEITILRRSGRKVDVAIEASFIYSSEQPIVLFGFFDLTDSRIQQQEREQLIREMSQVSKLADLGLLAAGVAHEINNPLAIVRGYAEKINICLKAENTKPQDIGESVTAILKAVDRMSLLVKQMRQLLRSEGAPTTTFDLYEITHELIRFMNFHIKAKKVFIENQLKPGLIVQGEGPKISQVILNIVSNAVQAMDEMSGKKKILISSQTEKNWTVLKIWNNGPSIDQEIQQKILTPFFTTKEIDKGTGLGLSISNSIMISHSGKIEFNSDKEQGTTFSLRFPRINSKSQGSEDLKKKKVLIVDDEKYIRKLIIHKLEPFNFDILEARNGRYALKLLKSQDKPIDTLIVDLRMPHIDGFEVVKKAKEEFQVKQIIVISGFLDFVDLSEISEYVDAFLGKPINHREFIRNFSPQDLEKIAI